MSDADFVARRSGRFRALQLFVAAMMLGIVAGFVVAVVCRATGRVFRLPEPIASVFTWDPGLMGMLALNVVFCWEVLATRILKARERKVGRGLADLGAIGTSPDWLFRTYAIHTTVRAIVIEIGALYLILAGLVQGSAGGWLPLSFSAFLGTILAVRFPTRSCLAEWTDKQLGQIERERRFAAAGGGPDDASAIEEPPSLSDPRVWDALVGRVRQFQLFVGAMCGLIVVMLCTLVVVFLEKGELRMRHSTQDPETMLIVAAVILVAWALIPRRIVERRRKRIAKRTNLDIDEFLERTGDAGRLCKLFGANRIGGAALVASAVVFLAAVYPAGGHWLVMVLAVTLTVGLALHMPTRAGFRIWIKQQLRVLEQERSRARAD